MRARYNPDKPLAVQYVLYLKNLLAGFGSVHSIQNNGREYAYHPRVFALRLARNSIHCSSYYAGISLGTLAALPLAVIARFYADKHAGSGASGVHTYRQSEGSFHVGGGLSSRAAQRFDSGAVLYRAAIRLKQKGAAFQSNRSTAPSTIIHGSSHVRPPIDQL